MFNSLMPSLNIRSLPFVVFMGGFPSRLQNLSSGAIRPGGLLFSYCVYARSHRQTLMLTRHSQNHNIILVRSYNKTMDGLVTKKIVLSF